MQYEEPHIPWNSHMYILFGIILQDTTFLQGICLLKHQFLSTTII